MSLDIWLTLEVQTGNENDPTAEFEVHDANYTHNVSPMWREAGVYEALYKSDGKIADHIIDDLKAGIADMEANPEKYIAMNPPNGWGSYETALPWLRRLLAACERYPRASVGVSR